jgi:predicted dehydrogenase
MTRRTYKAAIIGCGKIAGIKDVPRDRGPINTHAQAYYRHPNFQLIAACDIDERSLSTFSEIWQIEASFQHASSMIEDNSPDVISICSPNEHHLQHIELLLQAEKPPKVIFVEKPICDSPEELKYLDGLLKESPLHLLVNHTRRFDPKHQDLAAMIQQKTFGGFVMGHCYYYGGWKNNGAHLIDTLRMFFGIEPVMRSVIPGKPGRPSDPCWDVEISVEGAPIFLQSFDENYFQLFEMDLFFESGRVLIKDFGGSIIVENMEIDALDQRVLKSYAGSPWQGLENPMYHAVDAMANFLKDESLLDETGATLPEVRKSMQLVWEVERMNNAY